MTSQWLSGYERDPERGAGHAPLPGQRKVILHTTETGPGTLTAIRDSWRGSANWGRGLPHFIIEGARVVQLLPLDTCAYTSKNGGIDANKAGCPVQVEVVAHAAEGFDDETYETVGRWIADLIRAGVDLDLGACPRFYGPADGIRPFLASEGSPVRALTRLGYPDLNTIIGHQHLWGQDHWDPGPIDIERVCDIARRHLGGEGEDLTMADIAALIAASAQNAENVAGEVRREADQTRRDVIGAIRSIEANLAGVVRGTSAEELASVLAQLKTEGQVPGDIDVGALATSVVARLADALKT